MDFAKRLIFVSCKGCCIAGTEFAPLHSGCRIPLWPTPRPAGRSEFSREFERIRQSKRGDGVITTAIWCAGSVRLRTFQQNRHLVRGKRAGSIASSLLFAEPRA